MKKIKQITVIAVLILLFISCNNQDKEKKITIFHAGSLSLPFKIIIKEFNKENPNIKVFAESSGSLDAARKVTDLKKECDILAVADFLVIKNLLIPQYASWNFVFAANEMVIAYTKDSRYFDQISADNWNDILLKDDAYIGRSEPNSDPCGYRAVFVFELAEKFFGQAGLKKDLMNKGNTVIRPKEVDLLALLEMGNIDYLMIYKSVAIQHGLKYIELPDEINLSNPEFEELYNSVSITVNGSEKGTKAEIMGSSILYSLTIPLNSKNEDLAIEFILFLTDSEKGGKILIENGMQVLNYCKDDKDLPKKLLERLN
jgi:molybdate/tungstate transport system substrate-binding protein